MSEKLVDDLECTKKWIRNQPRSRTDEPPSYTIINEKIPTELLILLNGTHRKIVENVSLEKPSWYSENKFKRGQKFANDHYGLVSYADMLTLLILFSFRGNLSPLIYTKRSETAEKAGKRYLSTALRVMSWYEEDVWDKNSSAYKNILAVRSYHKSAVKHMQQYSKRELEEKTAIRGVLPPSEIKCMSLGALKKDVIGACPFWIEETVRSGYLLNQSEMSITLFGFMGLVILYPEEIGIFGATQQDLEGFIHLWRTLGYLLGVEDEFNMCQGSFDTVKLRCKQIVDTLFIPNLPNLSEEWEHMARCMVEGIAMVIPGATFETAALHLFSMTGIQVTNYRRQLKWKFILKYYLNRLMMPLFMRFNFVRVKFNSWVKSRMRLKELTLLKAVKKVADHNENI